MEYTAQSIIEFIKVGNIAKATGLYNKAMAKFAKSKTYNIPVLEGANAVYAEAGDKYLVPFVNTMFNYLEKHTS